MRDNYEVLIIGGGPVGMVLAYDLGMRGVSCLVVDNGQPTLTKKAGSCNTRTMEYLRSLGLADLIKQAAPATPGVSLDVVFATGMAGEELHRFANCLGWKQTADSPERTHMISQKSLRDLVAKAADNHFPHVDFALDCTGRFESQDDNGVVISLGAPDGKERTVTGRYLVGCDGGRSTVRKDIGAQLEGEGNLNGNLRVLFQSPEFYDRITLKPAQQNWIVNKDVSSSFSYGRGFRDDGELITATFWNVSPELSREIIANPEPYIWAGAGFEFPLTVSHTDFWATHNLVADRYRKQSVFLAGDSAHLHPPTGGLGLNTGIMDVSNLGWKLAARLKGWGGEALLDSYEAERRAIGKRVVAQANHNYRSGLPSDFYEEGLQDNTREGEKLRAKVGEKIFLLKNDEFNAPGLVLGYTYAPSPVIVDDGTPIPEPTVVEFSPSARPGSRLPHTADPTGIPLYDRLSSGLNLLVVGSDRSAHGNVIAAAYRLEVPLQAIHLPEKFRDLYGAQFLIVRPDQHVAWRGDELPSDPEALLREVTGLAA